MSDYMLFWMVVGLAAAAGALLLGLLAYWAARPLRVRRNKRLIERYGTTLKEARRGPKR